MSITVTVDVDVDYDEFSNDDIYDLIEDRISMYERQESRASSDKDKAGYQKKKQDFIDGVLVSMDRESFIKNEPYTLLDEQYNEIFETIRSKFSLEELQTFVNQKP